MPKWIAPVIRKMCRKMETPKAVPHVLAGVESILTLPSPGGEQTMEGKIPALVAAVWFFVMQELTGKETTGKEFASKRNKILAEFKGMRDDVLIVGKVGADEEAWKGWETVGARDVKGWVQEVTSNGWLELDWFTNIDNGGAGGHQEESEDERPRKLAKREGLGMMMQDRYDYLSQENKAEYAAWRDTMLGAIENLIKEGIMDVDT